MKLVLTAEAKSDVASSAAWYRDRSLVAAERFLLALGVALTRIEANPTSQVVVDPETQTRRALLRKFPHRLLYFVDDDTIVVIAVMHHRRDEPAWRKRLK